MLITHLHRHWEHSYPSSQNTDGKETNKNNQKKGKCKKNAVFCLGGEWTCPATEIRAGLSEERVMLELGLGREQRLTAKFSSRESKPARKWGQRARTMQLLGTVETCQKSAMMTLPIGPM